MCFVCVCEYHEQNGRSILVVNKVCFIGYSCIRCPKAKIAQTFVVFCGIQMFELAPFKFTDFEQSYKRFTAKHAYIYK